MLLFLSLSVTELGINAMFGELLGINLIATFARALPRCSANYTSFFESVTRYCTKEFDVGISILIVSPVSGSNIASVSETC